MSAPALAPTPRPASPAPDSPSPAAPASATAPASAEAPTSATAPASDGPSETLQAARETTPLAELHEALRTELAHHFTSRAPAAERYGPQFAHLWQLTAEHAQGGKLVRPALLVRAHRAMSQATGRSWVSEPQLLSLAAALELLHFAFLLHDDVIDGDSFRRGQLNLVGTLSAEREPSRADAAGARPTPAGLHWGQTGAILAGNLLLSQVHQVFARTPLPDDVRGHVLDLLDHAITESVAGEHADVALSDGVTTADLDTILTTAARKTGTYTFALPLALAAVLADAPPAWHAPLGEAAHHLGLAFQLRDDYLSTFGDAARHGKDPFSDLREDKATAIIAFARLTSAWPRVRSCFGDGSLSEADAARAVEALRECGADRFVHGLVLEHREALAVLLADDDAPQRAGSAPALPAGVRALLRDLDAELVGRQS